MSVAGSVLDYVLDGLEQALELERELGVRTVEIDRALLSGNPAGQGSAAVRDRPQGVRNVVREPPQGVRNLVFLHDRPLSGKGVEMMAKILTAMGPAAESAPVVVAPPLPKAKIVVVLGGLALRKHLPGMRGEPGQWLKTPGGTDVLVTYSPEYILRFATVTPAVRKIKQDMWRSLKAVMQRLR